VISKTTTEALQLSLLNHGNLVMR